MGWGDVLRGLMVERRGCRIAIIAIITVHTYTTISLLPWRILIYPNKKPASALSYPLHPPLFATPPHFPGLTHSRCGCHTHCIPNTHTRVHLWSPDEKSMRGPAARRARDDGVRVRGVWCAWCGVACMYVCMYAAVSAAVSLEGVGW